MNQLVRRVTLGRTNYQKYDTFKAGDTIGVYVKVKEGNKERIQLFKGVVIKVQGKDMGRSFTVRKISSGVGVERTFPFTSPSIDKIKLISRGKVRRSRLLYLRKLSGRAARLESTLVHEGESSIGAASEVNTPAEAVTENATQEPITDKK